MNMTTILAVAVLAGCGALAPVSIARMRTASGAAKAAIAFLFLLPVLAVSFLPALSAQLHHTGRILALAAFGVTFIAMEAFHRNRRKRRDGKTELKAGACGAPPRSRDRWVCR